MGRREGGIEKRGRGEDLRGLGSREDGCRLVGGISKPNKVWFAYLGTLEESQARLFSQPSFL